MFFIKAECDKRYRVYLVLTSLLIIFVCIFNINKLFSPFFVPDEMGYWTAGAWLNGLDWSEVMSTGGYYAFGYGFLLAPLFLLDNPVIMYRVAVLMNIAMLLGCYFLLIQICGRLFEKVNKRTILFICFTTTMYSYHIVYSQLTQAEIFLTLLFLTSVRILLWLCDKPGFLNSILFALSIGAMFASHMRTLVIIISASICILLMLFKKQIKFKYVFSYVMALGFIILFSLEVKNQLIADEYTAQTGLVLSHNDFSGRVWVVQLLFTLDGIKRLLLNFFSRIFYLGCSTFLLFYFGLYSIGETLIVWIKKKCLYSFKIVINLYIVLSCLAGIAMGSAAMILPSRADHVQYGRYYENLVALIIALGIYKIITIGKDHKKFFWIVAIHSALCFVTMWVFKMNPKLSDPLILQNTGIAGFYSKYDVSDPIFFTVVICIIAFIGGSALYYILSRKEIFGERISILALAFVWAMIAYKGLDENVYARQWSYKAIQEISQEVLKDDIQNIYYLMPEKEEGGKFFDIYNLQFSLGTKKIRTIHLEQLGNIKWKNGDCLLVHKEIGVSEEVMRLFEPVFENVKFYVLKYR